MPHADPAGNADVEVIALTSVLEEGAVIKAVRAGAMAICLKIPRQMNSAGRLAAWPARCSFLHRQLLLDARSSGARYCSRINRA
jgi:hypothetical protein